MLRYSFVALFVVANSLMAGSPLASAQSPEVTIQARSLDEFQLVIRALGEKSELFGLSGPDTFLTNYGQYIDTTKPFVCAMTISTPVPKFVTELSATNTSALMAALAQEGFVLQPNTGELSKADSGLRFFVEQNGSLLRIADSADYLQKARLPAANSFNGPQEAAVTVNVDWRNLSLASRSAVCRRGLSVLLPATNDPALTFEGLPGLVNGLASERMSAIMNRADSFTLRFNIDQEKRVLLTTDVLHRSIGASRTVDTPFAQPSAEAALLNCQWNLPIDNDLRTLVGSWAGLFTNNLKSFFGDQQIQDSQGWSTLQAGAKIIAQHCQETIALERLQGSLLVRKSGDQPVFALGLRVANAARLDSEIRKLIQSAIESGAPLGQPEFNIQTATDLSLHRLYLNLPQESNAADPASSALTITIGTSTHGLLIGVGPASETLVEELVAPTTARSTDWFSFRTTLPESNQRTAGRTPTSSPRVDPTAPAMAIQPTPQGFRITAQLPAVDAKRPAQYIGTRAAQPVQP